MAKSSPTRRADLDAALKRFKKGESISLEDLGRLWGVSKARFVNVRNDIADFPEHVGKQGNALLYPARPALESLLRHEKRHDSRVSARSAKVAKILGSRGDQAEEEGALPPSEMLALARAGAEIEKRRRLQGELMLGSAVAETAAQVFGYMSQTLGKLSDSVDPNGKLPGPTRTLLDGLGKDLLLRMHDDLSDMLGGNADAIPSRTAPARARTNRTRRTASRRKPG